MFNIESKPDILDLLRKIQEATTSDVDEERGSFNKGDKITYNMLGGGLTNSDLIRTLGANEHAIRTQHNGIVARIVEAMGEEVSRYSIQFNDGFVISDVAASELKAITEVKENLEKMSHEELGKFIDKLTDEIAHEERYSAGSSELGYMEKRLKKAEEIYKKTNEAEDATQTMKPQEKPDLSAEDLHMEDYSEVDLHKHEAEIKSKSEKSGDAIRGVEDKELEQTEDDVVKPKNESRVKEALKKQSRGDAIFQSTSSKVKDDADHFPINDADQARNALARANQYSAAPKWYDGSLDSLVKTVANAVKKKYPSIEVTKAAKKPGKDGKNESVAVEDELKDKVVVVYKKYRGTGKSREEAVQRVVKDFKDMDAPEIRKILAIEGVEESKFSFMKKQKPLWLCNECFKTFRNDESVCIFCESTNTDKIVEGYGDLAGSTKEVFKVIWRDEETGKEESTRIMAFDKDDAKREIERNPKKKDVRVEGPIKIAEKGKEVPFEQVSEDYREVTPGKYLVIYYDGYKEEIDAESKVDAMKKGRENYPEKRISNVKMVQQKEDIRKVESKLKESVSELIGETPGIDIENQKILRWAIENNVISNEWPTNENMIDQLSMEEANYPGIVEEEPDAGDLKPIYLKYILLPKATKVYAKSISESEWSDEMEQEGIPVAGRTYHIRQSVGRGWVEDDYKVIEVEYSRTVRGDLGKYFKVEGNDTWWLAKFYHFEEVGVEEAKKKEIKPFRTIEIVRSQVDPEVFNIRVVELPKGDIMILDTKSEEKTALTRGKELANTLNAKFLGIVDEKKIKESVDIVNHLTCPECKAKLHLVNDVLYSGWEYNESKLKEQEEDSLIIVAKGLEKEDAEKLAHEKDGQVIVDEENDQKFAVITKGE